MRIIKIVLLLIAVSLFIASHFVLELPTHEAVSESTETISQGDIPTVRTYEIPPGQKMTLNFTMLHGGVLISFEEPNSFIPQYYNVSLNKTENNTQHVMTRENKGEAVITYEAMFLFGYDGLVRVETIYQRDVSSSNYSAAQILMIAGFAFLILFMYSFKRTVRKMDVRRRPIRVLGIMLLLFGLLFFLIFQDAGFLLMLIGIVLMLGGAGILAFLTYGTRRRRSD